MVLEIAGGLFGQEDVRETPTLATQSLGGNVLMGRFDDSSTLTPGITRYLPLIGNVPNVDIDSSITKIKSLIPTAGTLQNFYVNVVTNSINGNVDFYIMVNEVATGLTIQYSSAETGQKSDTTNTFTIAAGDSISLRIITGGSSGSFADVRWGVELGVT